MMAKRRVTKTTLRPWLIRAGIGIAVGLLVGFAIGAVGVRIMQPSVTLAADAVAASAQMPRRPAAVNDEPATTVEPEQPVNGVVVPQLIGLEEGDARQAILRAGFKIGSVTFKSGPPPMGIVVTSFPVPGESVVLPAMINLILSDGKGSTDSTAVPPQPDDSPSALPNAS